MTIDQISEALGSMGAHLGNQTKAIDKLTESVSKINESLIRGSSRMTAIEVRQDKFEEHVSENIKPHVDNFAKGQERRIGAKMTWAAIGGGITFGLGLLGSVAISAVKTGAALLFAGGGH